MGTVYVCEELQTWVIKEKCQLSLFLLSGHGVMMAIHMQPTIQK
jgi:hypothetical protein